jgi:hypothetical protein
MILMGAISLMVGLKTVPFRRSHDAQEPLAFLPADTNVIALAQVQQALQDVGGRQLLSQFNLGPLGADLGTIEQWTGLRRDDIQTVVLGLRVDDRLPPRVTLVVQTQVPYQEAKLVAGLKDAERLERGSKTLYRVPFRGQALGATLWCASESILVMALLPDDFDAIGPNPGPSATFALPLQSYIGDHLGPESQLWIIGHSDHWDQTIAQPLLARLLADYPDLMANLETWGIALHFDEKIQVSGNFQLKSDESAIKFARYLSGQSAQKSNATAVSLTSAVGLAGSTSTGAFVPLTGSALGASRTTDVRVESGAWVRFQYQFELGNILAAVRRYIAGAILSLGR